MRILKSALSIVSSPDLAKLLLYSCLSSLAVPDAVYLEFLLSLLSEFSAPPSVYRIS